MWSVTSYFENGNDNSLVLTDSICGLQVEAHVTCLRGDEQEFHSFTPVECIDHRLTISDLAVNALKVRALGP